jgi:hypothetical protein
MANNVYHQLCEREAGWYDITELAREVKAYENSNDVADIAEVVLLERRYIERDLFSLNVKLTQLGRENCVRGISIPPSDIQKLIELFEKTRVKDKISIKVIRSTERPKRISRKKATKKKATKKKATKKKRTR